MKLEQLFETLQIKDTTELAEYLLKNCAPFLKDIKFQVAEKIMYRGMNGISSKRVTIKQVRQGDRAPMTLSDEIHKLTNQYFKDKFGHPYRNGLFATGTKHDAERYGTAYAIFPIGDYDCLWSPDVEDLYGELNDALYSDDDEFMDAVVKSVRWKDGDIIGALESGNEIMIWTKKYMAVNLLDFKLGTLEGEIRKYK